MTIPRRAPISAGRCSTTQRISRSPAMRLSCLHRPICRHQRHGHQRGLFHRPRPPIRPPSSPTASGSPTGDFALIGGPARRSVSRLLHHDHGRHRGGALPGHHEVKLARHFLFDPRASLVWEPVREPDLLHLLGQGGGAAGHLGGGFARHRLPRRQSAALKPDKSENIEVGAKFSLFDGHLGLTAAAFNETKGNALQTDPNTGTVSLQSSQKRAGAGRQPVRPPARCSSISISPPPILIWTR